MVIPQLFYLRVLQFPQGPKRNHEQALSATTEPGAQAWRGPVRLGLWLWLLMAVLFFSKKYLPVQISQVLSRFYFWPTMPLTLFRSWMDGRGLWCQVDDTVILGVAPLAILDQPAQLEALGVRAVVNLCEEYAGPQAEYSRLKITQLRLPTVDHQQPPVQDLCKAVAFIDAQRKLGHKVYIHCKAGHGRAGALAMAWMIFTHGVYKEEDLQKLNAELLQKRHVRRSLYRQLNLKDFASQLHSTGGACVRDAKAEADECTKKDR